ncbi:enoyl-CoA hydratase/isomerase family protein [Oceanicoccus sp. KOV_DT_Chl]|uniref:enoyl-CoA hydratase/isomerase family protein n=1 Tax=Oceanicoccus sp. KOV_DT_Chl TaxID=1904639 RepID=UPI000C7A3FF4|nr:enoyl-CoA hydratase-related protein [Oceanicoccus sp. KOV_DT_Chl]
MNTFETVNYQVKNSLAIITLNRPEVRNSLNRQMRMDIAAALAAASADKDVRVMLITGEGKGFCAGADLVEKLPGDNQDGFITKQLNNEYNPIIQGITDAPKPVIGAINGAAAGIGSAIALSCDLVIMADNAFLYSAFGAISLIPDGGSHKLFQDLLGAKKAYEMIAFSQRLTAQQCIELGVANKVVAADSLLSEATEWALQLAAQAPLTLRYSKELLKKAATSPLAEVLAAEAEIQNTCYRSEDFQEGAAAFFEKRAPKFQGK